MIKANFNAYNNYVTDSVYQWDINRELSVTGLNLSVAPEVHFSNCAMDRCIVRQATSEYQIISVQIPNSLLQYSYPIKAYIGIYEGDTFKVIETITIPVIAKERPFDYKFEDTDGEIYSINALENLVNDAVSLIENNNAILTEQFQEELNEIDYKITLQKNSGCVLFSNAYKNASGADFIFSSMIPLLNAENYSNITINDVVKIVGTESTVGASRFTISRYGTGFCLYSTDSMAVQTVAGKAVSFEFTLTE